VAPTAGHRAESLVVDGEILIDGLIEPAGRICVAAIRRALAEVSESERVVIRITAGVGGYGEEALRIYTMLRDHLRPVIAHVERAASAETLLVMAAQEVTIVEGGGFLVHAPPRAHVR
jgi:ATP-dependent protease ClpP protease subunit